VAIESWRNPESPWWAKLRRAGRHIAELRQMIDDFERGRPWSITAEAGTEQNELAYRLQILRPVPSDLITAAGLLGASILKRLLRASHQVAQLRGRVVGVVGHHPLVHLHCLLRPTQLGQPAALDEQGHRHLHP
jgi:hypothetical protein